MKKKLLILAMVCVLSFSLTTPVYAATWYSSHNAVATESYQGGTWKHSYVQNGPSENDYRMHYSYYYNYYKGSITKVLYYDLKMKENRFESVPAAPGYTSSVNGPSWKIKDIKSVYYYVNV